MLQHAAAGTEQAMAILPATLQASVTVLRKHGKCKVVDLHHPVTIFGSDKDVKIRLKHPTVAPAHAAIINTGLSLVLCDLASRAGTLLNEERVTHAELKTGDIIRIDAWRFRVDIDQRATGDSCSGSSIAATQFCTHSTIDLEMSDGSKRWVDLSEVFIIGRRDTCEVSLPGSSVSRAHALVCSIGGRPAIVDLKSANGLKVNGRSVATTYLSPGDVISIGDHQVKVSDIRAPGLRMDPQESCYMFGGMGNDRIRLAGPGHQGSSVDYVRFAGQGPPRLRGSSVGRIEYRPISSIEDSRAGLAAELTQREQELTQRAEELDALAKKLADLSAEQQQHQQVLDGRELEMGDREHLLRSSARKLVDTHHAKVAKDTEGARLELEERTEAMAAKEQEIERLEADLEQQRAPLESAKAAIDERERQNEESIAARQSWVDRATEELEAVRNELDTREQDQRATEVALKQRETSISKLDGQIQVRDAELSEQAGQLESRSREQHELDESLQKRSEELSASGARLEDDLKSLDTRARELERSQRERSQQFDNLRRELDTRTADLESRSARLQQDERLATERETEIAQRLALLDERQRVMSERESALQERADALVERKHAMDRREAELGERHHDLESRSADFDRRDKEFGKRDKELGRREKRIAQGDSSVQRLAEELKRREKSFGKTEKELSKREGELDRERVKIETHKCEIEQWAAEMTQATEQRQAEVEGQEEAQQARSEALAKRHAEFDKQRQEIDADRAKAQEFEQRLANDRRSLESRREEFELLQAASSAADGATRDERDRELAKRAAAMAKKTKVLEISTMELEARERQISAKEPEISKVAKSLDVRSAAMDTRETRIKLAQNEAAQMRRALDERAEDLREREAVLEQRQDDLETKASDPLAVSDERSFEVLRLLDPDLGDSVRVLKRLGVGGSFDDLVSQAQDELRKRAAEKKGRSKWSLFG